MTFFFRPRLRHPFFPALSPTRAQEARSKAPAQALCGPFPELVRAAARGVTVERAVFVLLEGDAPPLIAEQRDLLWDLFQTPVYALQLDHKRRVCGFECEAQNGFHAPGRHHPDTPICECGRPRPLYEPAGVAGTLAPMAVETQ